jgi:NAD(P)H-flavin reductase/hemoglobin-like flavoprotein
MARRLSLPEPLTDQSPEGGGAPPATPDAAASGEGDDSPGDSALSPLRPSGRRRSRAGKSDQGAFTPSRDRVGLAGDDGPLARGRTTLGHPAPEGSPPWEPAPEPGAVDGLAEPAWDDPEGPAAAYADSGWSEALDSLNGATGAVTPTAGPAGEPVLVCGAVLACGAGLGGEAVPPREPEPAGDDGLADGTGLASDAGLAGDGPADGIVQAGPDFASMRAAFAVAETAGEEALAYCYGWLFARQPELRELFPAAMEQQRDRLLAALAQIVGERSTPEEMASYLGQLGRDHRKYGVTPQMYDLMGEALTATLRAFGGPAFTPAAEEAWASTYTAASALMVQGAAAAGSREPARWRARVLAHETPAEGVARLTIAPDQPLRYQAGQHLSVQTPRWPRVWRRYSIAGRPRPDGLIRLHVKAVPGGWVSNALVHHTRPGDQLILSAAVGTMTLPAAGDRDLLCVAGGTGLAPVKAIAEAAVQAAERGRPRRRIYLFYGGQRRDDLYDLEDLWRLADTYDQLHLTPVTSNDPEFSGRRGRVGRVAARYLPHPDCEAFVAGPAGMVHESIRALGQAGLPRERIHFDGDLLGTAGRPGGGA